MIDTLNTDSKVGVVLITLDTNSQWNDQIIQKMMNSYINIYDI